MVQTWYALFLLSIASFRLTRLIVYDQITSFIRRPFHEEIEETGPDGTVETYIQIKGKGLRHWIGELLSCYWCTGIWCAALLYLLWCLAPRIAEPAVLILAIAGIGSVIETVVRRILD
ncbi:DUF1360 domain-containing protein [Heyndrickxia acidicola]|uniref:DUF1360 domain-containing protein n=1 Tax=Heyndrickxia acidicola TaxID=209389 RepID=A0ABU6MDM8_9BACI|nr:DUF1360 domain-containing protein [Heyndrickxia acidicola]MED1202539.1 DUF1360 domain-containing protein [Heyndrickxia acidicola]